MLTVQAGGPVQLVLRNEGLAVHDVTPPRRAAGLTVDPAPMGAAARRDSMRIRIRAERSTLTVPA